MSAPSSSSISVIKTQSRIVNPPGSFLMWLIVLVEILMFGVFLVAVARERSLDPRVFKTERLHLLLQDGVAMTLALLCSGFFAAEGVRFFFQNERKKSLILFLLSTFLGMVFLFLKILDFSHKSQLGLVVEKNSFWQMYWLIMGFHFFHVMVGVLILMSISFQIYRNKVEDPEFSIRGGTLFWHMCDIVWLVIFPIFYLGGPST